MPPIKMCICNSSSQLLHRYNTNDLPFSLFKTYFFQITHSVLEALDLCTLCDVLSISQYRILLRFTKVKMIWLNQILMNKPKIVLREDFKSLRILFETYSVNAQIDFCD